MVDAVLSGAIAHSLGAPMVDAVPVAGGDVNRALRVRTGDGRSVFVKHHPEAPAGMYVSEAEGLRWLAAAAAVRVPEVVAVRDELPRFLALEWIDRGPNAPGHDETLGRGLAALHLSGAPTFGLDRDNFIATLPQTNAPETTWTDFYATRRLLPLSRRLVDAGKLTGRVGAQVERLCARLADLCGPGEPPSRLHGDLWGGNAMTDAHGAPVLIDPAVFGGHREVDLAMMRLFGGFGPRVFAAYGEAAPLAAGHEDRIDLYQLWPLLVHVALFGGGYAARVADAVGRYVR